MPRSFCCRQGALSAQAIPSLFSDQESTRSRSELAGEAAVVQRRDGRRPARAPTRRRQRRTGRRSARCGRAGDGSGVKLISRHTRRTRPEIPRAHLNPDGPALLLALPQHAIAHRRPSAVRTPVKSECVPRFLSDELFEHFATRLLCLGHGMNARIITASDTRAKRVLDRYTECRWARCQASARETRLERTSPAVRHLSPPRPSARPARN